MSRVEDIWSSKPDAQVRDAAARLEEYSAEAQSAILNEVARRQLVVHAAVDVPPEPSIVQCYARGWKQFATFRGRAGRREYLAFLMGNVAIFFAVLFVGDFSLAARTVVVLFLLSIQLPQQALFVRRLHDTGKSAWWLLLELIPFVGGVCLLGLLLKGGEPDRNQWGDPVSSLSSAHDD